MHELWDAPTATGPVDATVVLPGSKSVTNRALVLAALAGSPSQLRRPLRARDTLLMVGALRALGATITDHGDDWGVTPGRSQGDARVDCGLAGTVMRFVPPAAASLATGNVTFDGDPPARVRPMVRILDALRALGASIDDGGRGSLPFVLHGSGSLPGGAVTIDASASSQFVSGLLLAGTSYDKGLTVHHDGKPIPSLPHIDMTVALLRTAGAEVDDIEPNTWHVEPGPLRGLDLTIEPDLSNAAPFLAAALVTGGTVRVEGWPRSTTQAGDALRDLLARMGADVALDEDALTIHGTGVIHGLDVDLHDVGELTPVIAALAALAETPSRLRGIAHLRGHETDRLAALAHRAQQSWRRRHRTDDGLSIDPRPLRGGMFACYADHRMAQAGAVLGLAVHGVQVQDIATTGKTFPDFSSMWVELVGGPIA